MTGIGVGPNTPGVLAVVGALGTDAGPLPHPAASSAKEAPTASRVTTFLVIEGRIEREDQVINVIGRRFRELKTREIIAHSRDFH